jgi:hypothetical protein
MIKIHSSDEGASSLLKINLSEEKKKKKKENSLARLSQEKNEMRDYNYLFSLGLTVKYKILYMARQPAGHRGSPLWA